MKLTEAKQKFIDAWGLTGSSWGINRTMAQIHALLLISHEPLSAETIMEELKISRGNVNMNLHALMDWRLAQKVHKPGERKEFFEAEKDIWEVARRIMEERKKRELEPVIRSMEEITHLDGDPKDPANLAFLKTVNDITKFAGQIDKLLAQMSKAADSAFISTILKIVKIK